MRFRFHQWNDLHLRGDGLQPSFPNLERAPEYVAWLVNDANEKAEHDPIDFVLSVGDLIDGDHDAIALDYQAMNLKIIQPAPGIVLPCPGNHEMMEVGHVIGDGTEYDAAFGPGMRQYCFQHCGIAFIVLDTSSVTVEDHAKFKEREVYLREMMLRTAPLPVIIVSHTPLYPVREPDILKTSFGLPYWVMPDSDLQACLKEHRERVIAVLSGHVHISGMCDHDGIRQILVGGVAGKPLDYAIHEIHDDHMLTKMVAGPKAIEDISGVHGRPRHEVDYVDAQHATHDLYLYGNPEEREFKTTIQKPSKSCETLVNGIDVLKDMEGRLGRHQQHDVT